MRQCAGQRRIGVLSRRDGEDLHGTGEVGLERLSACSRVCECSSSTAWRGAFCAFSSRHLRPPWPGAEVIELQQRWTRERRNWTRERRFHRELRDPFAMREARGRAARTVGVPRISCVTLRMLRRLWAVTRLWGFSGRTTPSYSMGGRCRWMRRLHCARSTCRPG